MTWLSEIRQQYNQKAISHHPELDYRQHITVSARDEIGPVSIRDYTDYADVYATQVWVRKGIKVIQDLIAPLPIRVVEKGGGIVENNEITESLAFVNDQHGPFELWSSWAVHMILGGEAFVEVVPNEDGAPKEFWIRRPDQVGVQPDQNRPLYPAAAGYTWQNEEYAADEMIQWKFTNPLSPWRGLSLIGAARASIVIDIYAQAWHKRFLRKGGNPDWALIAPEGMTASEREEYERILEAKFLGHENWHKPIVLEKGITDIKPLSFPPKDMQWLEQRKLSREEIGAILGVLDVLMGFGPETYDTEEKRSAALRTTWAMTLIPLIRLRDDGLQSFFSRRFPLLEKGQRIVTDLSSVNVLQKDITPKIESARTLFQIGYPLNLIDERLNLGLGPVAGGDVGYLPLNLIPATRVGNRADEKLALLQEKMFVLLSDGNRTTNNDNAEPPLLEAGSEVRGEGMGTLVYASPEHRSFLRRRDAQTRVFEERAIATLKKYFQRQQIEVGRRLREMAKSKIPEASAESQSAAERKVGKQETPILPLLDELFDLNAEALIFRDDLRPDVQGLFAVSGSAALRYVLGTDAGEFDIQASVVAQAIEHILWRQSVKTNNTTWEGLTLLFQEAEEEGASIPRISEMLSDYFGGRKSTYQTSRIARTTMIGSHNAASYQAYSQSGVVYGNEWLAALDTRTRDTHVDAHGQFQPIGGRFEVGAALLLHPGDPDGPVEEIVFCRCSILPVIRE